MVTGNELDLAMADATADLRKSMGGQWRLGETSTAQEEREGVWEEVVVVDLGIIESCRVANSLQGKARHLARSPSFIAPSSKNIPRAAQVPPATLNSIEERSLLCPC